MQSSLYRRVGRDIRRASLGARRRHRDDFNSGNTVSLFRAVSTTHQRFHDEGRLTQSVSNLPSRKFHSSSSFSSKSSGVNLAPATAAHHTYFNDDDDTFDDELELSAQKYLDMSFQRSLELELGEASVWGDFNESDDYSDDMEDEDVYAEEMPEDVPRSFDEILAAFKPDKSPSVANLEELQVWLECSSVEESTREIQKSVDSARERKDYASMGFVQRHVVRWFPALRDSFADIQKDYILKKEEKTTPLAGSAIFGPYISIVPPEKLAVIAAHEAIMAILNKSSHKDGVTTYASVCTQVGQAVEDEIIMQRILRKKKLENDKKKKKPSADDEEGIRDGKFEWIYGAVHLKDYITKVTKNDSAAANSNRAVKLALARTKKAMESEESLQDREKIQIGAILLHALFGHATFKLDGKEEKVFRHEVISGFKKGAWRSQGIVTLNESFADMISVDEVLSFPSTTTRYKPMVIPPKKWTSPDDGGYLWLKAPLMRSQGSSKLQQAVLNVADMTTLNDGLNVLGSVAWKVNEKTLEAANRCWDENFPLGEIPSRTDFELPPKPEKPVFVKQEKGTPMPPESLAEWDAYKQEEYKYKRVKQRNNDLQSLRCTVTLKIDQAKQFMAFDKFYYPYNVDFRGRTYPIPPHFSTVGSDLCRGMLKFAEAKPLGKRGLFWLKVHLANLAGYNKVTFEDRAVFVDENIVKVRRSAEEPFEGERWWTTLEDPFQALATCIEITNAIDSGDPESYMCSHPVHMDGSCNGLQHYAALGLDPVGGKAVNLCPEEKPQDVYSGVMHEVIRRVAEEAKRKLDFDIPDPENLTFDESEEFTKTLSAAQLSEYKSHCSARFVDGLIDRGVVKRTVMTNVYGVTFIGAREQIREKILEKLIEQDPGRDIDDRKFRNDLFLASSYLAKLTMGVIGDLFVGARETMTWLAECAQELAKHGYPVAWISPIGVPSVQPYRSKKNTQIVTVTAAVCVVEEDDSLELQKSKQVTAFPPNFVHSLDSSHMMLTALEMDRRGLTFAAVHDSFWTHPCDIDEMNVVLREVFVDLYRRPILSELKESWEMRYPDVVFPDVPKQGDLDLDAVKSAPYFFQ